MNLNTGVNVEAYDPHRMFPVDLVFECLKPSCSMLHATEAAFHETAQSASGELTERAAVIRSTKGRCSFFFFFLFFS